MRHYYKIEALNWNTLCLYKYKNKISFLEKNHEWTTTHFNMCYVGLAFVLQDPQPTKPTPPTPHQMVSFVQYPEFARPSWVPIKLNQVPKSHLFFIIIFASTHFCFSFGIQKMDGPPNINFQISGKKKDKERKKNNFRNCLFIIDGGVNK